MCNTVEGILHTLISFPTPDTYVTSPDTGIEHDDDVGSEFSPHRTVHSFAHQKRVGGGRCTEVAT